MTVFMIATVSRLNVTGTVLPALGRQGYKNSRLYDVVETYTASQFRVNGQSTKEKSNSNFVARSCNFEWEIILRLKLIPTSNCSNCSYGTGHSFEQKIKVKSSTVDVHPKHLASKISWCLASRDSRWHFVCFTDT